MYMYSMYGPIRAKMYHLAIKCTVYFFLSPVQAQEHQWVRLSCSE